VKIRVIVAAHKKSPMPRDEMYLPVHVGAAGKGSLGYQRDDEGENISSKNPYYCELTGLYWAWKNLDADFVGLAHYRRHFGKRKGKDALEGVLTYEEAERLLRKAPILLPKKRNYYIENLYDHYAHTLHPQPLALVGEILREKYPRYYPEFCRLKKRRSAHMFNMMILSREKLDGYCSFLFPVLEELERRVDPSEYADSFHARFPGRISELLLDVYLNTNGEKYVETPFFLTQGERWGKKIFSFLASKFFGKKYGKSF